MKIKKIVAMLLIAAMTLGIISLEDAKAASKYYAYSSTKQATTTVNLKMRTGASTSYKSVQTIPKGAKITVYGYVAVTGDDWYKVKYNGKTGYSISTYIKTVSTSSSSSSSSTSSSASSIKGSNIAYPTSLKLKQAFTVKGTVKSTYNIRYIKAGVKNSSGNWVSGVCASSKPYVKNYDLKRLDYYIAFNKLKAGTYNYVVYAEDSKGKCVTVLKKQFTVGTVSKITANSITYPTEIKSGSSFTMKGSLSSNYNIKYVKAGIKNSSSQWMSGYFGTASPYVKSYNLNKLDSKVPFEKLKAGTYYYAVYAEDTNGKKLTVFSKKFTVKAASKISISNYTYPTGEYDQGKYFTFKGKISSTYKLSSVEVGVIDKDGKQFSGCYVKATPNTLSYDIAEADKKLQFNILTDGSYRYVVIAKDSQGVKKTLIEKTFTIKDKSIAEVPDTNIDEDFLLEYDKEVFSKIGKQPKSGPCGLYAMAYGRLVMDGEFKIKANYGSVCDQLIDEYGNGSSVAYWGNACATSIWTTSAKAAYQKVMDELASGKPCIIPVNGNYGNHFVLVIGYKKGTTKSNVSLDKLIILDPAYGDQCSGTYHDGYRDKPSDEARYIKFYS